MNADEFKAKVGRKPEHDDLERINCGKVGDAGHRQCGWCSDHDKPRFECGCLTKDTPKSASLSLIV